MTQDSDCPVDCGGNSKRGKRAQGVKVTADPPAPGGAGLEEEGGEGGVEEGEEEEDMGEPTFGVFVKYMLRTRGLLAFALHRYCPTTRQHYVITMPPAALVLHEMDFAFVLTPGGPLLPQQEKVMRKEGLGTTLWG